MRRIAVNIVFVSILVTGAAGYIGSIASKILLEKGYEVVGLDSLVTNCKQSIPEDLRFYEADISDSELLKKIIEEHKVDSIFHFAGLIQVGESVLEPEKYVENNLTKSKVFLDTVVASGIKSFVFSSSAAVYGSPVKEGLLKETDELAPINPYGQTKLDFEKELKKASKENDFNYLALRYFNVAGAYGKTGECHEPETHLIPLVLDAALGKRDSIKIFGTDYSSPDGTAIRDYVHVLDLVEGHIKALDLIKEADKTKLNRAFNLAYGEGFSVRQIINAVK